MSSGKYLSTTCTTSKTPVGYRAVSCLFQVVAIELVECEGEIVSLRVVSSHDVSDSIHCQNTNRLSTVTRAFALCFCVFHSDQRPEFDYELIREVHP